MTTGTFPTELESGARLHGTHQKILTPMTRSWIRKGSQSTTYLDGKAAGTTPAKTNSSIVEPPESESKEKPMVLSEIPAVEHALDFRQVESDTRRQG